MEITSGEVAPGEIIEQTAIKEVKEITDFDVKIVKLIGVYSNPLDGRIITYITKDDIVHLIDILLEALIISGKLTISSKSEVIFF